LKDIIEQYRKRSLIPNTDEEREGFHFSIAKQEILDNDYDLSFSKYRKEIYEELKYEKPKVIFKKLEVIEANILARLNELNELL
jgi:type I restriction enzyme M protein